MVAPSVVTEHELHAYLDGQLDDPSRVAAVEAYLAAHPEEAARLQAYRRYEEALRNGLDQVEGEAVPERLRMTVLSPRRRYWPRVAASVAWIAVGVALGWSLRGTDQPRGDPLQQVLVQPALIAHAVYTPEVRHPVEVTAREEAHLAAWLTKRLGAKVTVPPLQSAGFNLVGGRLLPAGDGEPAAQFMYEDDSGKRLTLYVRRMRRGESPLAFRYEVRDGVGVFYWIDASFAYALSGELGRERLMVAARLVYQGLNP